MPRAATAASDYPPERCPLGAIIAVLSLFKGDYADAVRKLTQDGFDVDVPYLRLRISTNPSLAAMYNRGTNSTPLPNLAETEARKGISPAAQLAPALSEITPKEIAAAKVTADNDLELFVKGLAKAGVSERVIQRLEAAGSFSLRNGAMVAASFDMMHRLSSQASADLYGMYLDLLDMAADIKIEIEQFKDKDPEAASSSRQELRSIIKQLSAMHNDLLKGYHAAKEGTLALFKIQMGIDAARRAKEGKGKDSDLKANPHGEPSDLSKLKFLPHTMAPDSDQSIDA